VDPNNILSVNSFKDIDKYYKYNTREINIGDGGEDEDGEDGKDNAFWNF